MALETNVADVEVDFKDVYGETITDEVEIKIYNTQLQSLKNGFTVKFKGQPAVLTGVPAFPTGHADMIITPKKYKNKKIQINVQSGVPNRITEYFFVEPSKARPRGMEFADLPSKLYGAELTRILANSNIDEAAWDKLDKRNRATILNLSAKMWRETVGGEKLIKKVDSIDRTWLDPSHRERIYANVKPGLLPALRGEPGTYPDVNGGLHKFPPGGWSPAGKPDSFKTLKDSAGNIQLTFAENAGGALLADIDLDDHTGLKHVADVLKHKLTDEDTDPYVIHEILWFSQNLDAEYRLI